LYSTPLDLVCWTAGLDMVYGVHFINSNN